MSEDDVSEDGTAVRAEIAAERTALANVLAGLTERQWDSPSLCRGWRVREVVAHLTMSSRSTAPQLLSGLVRARGRFNVMLDRAARRDAEAMTSEQLVAAVRAGIDSPRKVPGAGYVGALSHDVIHGLDATVALGLPRRVPVERVGIVLRSVRPLQVRMLGADLGGVQLQADDLDWTYGSGLPVVGPAHELLLVLCGRTVPAGRLAGTAAGRFTAGGPTG